MIHATSPLAIAVFVLFVAITLVLSSYLGKKAKSSAGYFAAHGQIPWFVNGVAFAGDYLSAASFLGICGMIAFYGYDGFLYSIGYLAGWIVALFVVAEPMKRLGKFTFADALNARFNSPGIKAAAGISTLAVSIFYLIPQMVGAGVLVQPLLGLPHWVGVVLVGAVVIFIVVTAGMVSTTWVQFIKGALLLAFSTLLSVLILWRGFHAGDEHAELASQSSATRGTARLTADNAALDAPNAVAEPATNHANLRPSGYVFRSLGPFTGDLFDNEQLATNLQALSGSKLLPPTGPWQGTQFVQSQDRDGIVTTWSLRTDNEGRTSLHEAQTVTKRSDGSVLVNGLPRGTKAGENQLHPVGRISRLPRGETSTGPLGPLEFFRILQQSEVVLWPSKTLVEPDGSSTTVYFQKPTPGSQVLRPGESPTFAGIRSDKFFDKLNFLSLMLALFCGTASLPHILIRYYTVHDEAAARKSTIVGIACIGFFYVLTLYMGLGAMTSGSLEPSDSNMAAPLLARSFSELLFAVISAIAFTTVLGTVSGLILASAGAVTHDLLESIGGMKMNDHERVRIAKLASVVVGIVAISLGILFKQMNVTFLVGWAFSVAASANLPALVMLLFWPSTTRQGVIAAIIVGMLSSLAWILLSGDTFANVYGLPKEGSIVPFSQPGIVTIPLGFLTLIVVSLLSRGKREMQAA
ncbi:MAG: cation acetate symporter [Pirellulales bacterium]|nr:cation acetate symporter [Pirellulales bacterium]